MASRRQFWPAFSRSTESACDSRTRSSRHSCTGTPRSPSGERFTGYSLRSSPTRKNTPCISLAAPLTQTSRSPRHSRRRLTRRRGQRGVAQGQRAEPLGERDLPAVVQALAAQEHHLVVQEGLADPGHHFVAQRRAGVRAGDLGADLAGQPGESDVGGRGEGFGHDEMPFSSGNGDKNRVERAHRARFARAACGRREGQRVRQPELMTVRKSTWRRRVPR